MQDITVNVSCTKESRAGEKFSGTYSSGSTVEEAIQMFGAEAVLDGFHKSATIAIANVLRLAMQAGETDEQLRERLANYKPGVSQRAPRQAQDPVAAILAKAASLEGDAQAAFIQELIKKLRGAKV